ncbi:MAG: Flp pilus assembly complex ATPase component TadA [Planctomycetaceae bacterium]|jgi:type II secretory ATPase GspE/PulE/Tfp pilus assembly ATPase PilB-like protein|nr:Flp pilus assembly complex ATPase component TadA [Planctomycetaceae bacterium]
MIPVTTLTEHFETWLRESREQSGDFIVALIDKILAGAAVLSASDIHFQPGRNGIEVRFRIDGVLHILGCLPLEHSGQIAARLKVFAGLLTYKVDVPQEGRVRSGRIEGVAQEMRISSAPTLFGERIVVRFFSPENQCQSIESLGFEKPVQQYLHEAVARRSGAVLIVGPSGSGKTTTAYALLRELAYCRETTRSIVSLEDPIEHAIDGVAQIEVSSRPDSGGTEHGEKFRTLTLDRMLQYMMRQDPEVLMVGEIRERRTAEAAFQAALTGHLLISTFHGGSAVESIGRFLELGIEPFVLRSSIAVLLCQRLLRRLCSCSEKVEQQLEIRLQGKNLTVQHYFEPRGCPCCGGTGYAGRIPVSEILPLENEEIARAILERRATGTVQLLAQEQGMTPLVDNVVRRIETGLTSPLEAKRVLGH